MKKRNLLLGMVLVVGMAAAACGMSDNSEITRVEQESTQTGESEGMQASASKTQDDSSVDDVLVIDGADDAEVSADKGADQTVLDAAADNNQQKAADDTDEISEQEAKEIAFKDAGIMESDVLGIRVERDFDDGHHQYDIDFYAGNREYDYEIDVYTGEILSRDYDIEDDFEYGQSVQSSEYISREEAVKLVLDRVKGATENQVIIELDEDDGRLIYEGEVHYNNREFEFEMNAENGKILEWNEESAIE